MAVGNILSGYAVSARMEYSGTASFVSKTEVQFEVTKQSESSGDDVLDYYHEICSKFTDISFRLSDIEETLKHVNDSRPYIGYNDSLNQVGDNYSEIGKISIDIDVAVIRKMQSDSSFEEEVLDIIGKLEFCDIDSDAARNEVERLTINPTYYLEWFVGKFPQSMTENYQEKDK